MRIAILTLKFHYNFGGIIQAYALQTVLERMGHQVTVLDKARIMPKVDLPFSIKIKRFILKYCFFRHIEDLPEIKAYKEECLICKNTWAFVDKYIHRRGIKSFDEIKESDYDAIVVGSDQVWRPKYFKMVFKTDITDAYLGFTDKWNIKRIAYAPSFGTDKWEYSTIETEMCSSLISKFDAVSVRELSSVNLCKKQLMCDVTLSLDPTLLLNKDDYMALCLNYLGKHSGQVMTYFLDENDRKIDFTKHISKSLGKYCFDTNGKMEIPGYSVNQRVQNRLEEWLAGFSDADLIITDSFHACIFSIIFGKAFIVIGNRARGMSRITSLLNLTNMEYRFVNEENPTIERLDDIFKSVHISTQVLAMQKESFSFLKNALV